MRPPRVTVVVPVHNAGAFLVPALDSALAQTFTDFEVVVVDDASSDGSDEVARRYAMAHPDRFTAICLTENVGVARARDLAIRRSRGGELIALLDHDDRWREDYLEHTVACLDRERAAGRRVGIVACNALLEQDGRIIDTFAERYGWTEHIDVDAMIQRNCILARAVFCREGYDAVGGFAAECLASDDYDLWFRLLEAGWEVATTRETVVIWRLHAASQSRDQRLMADGSIAVFERALARGALTRPQRRAVRRRLRHHRALRARALVHEAAVAGHPAAAAARAVRAAPHGAVAFAQSPSRWGEWLAPHRRSTP